MDSGPAGDSSTTRKKQKQEQQPSPPSSSTTATMYHFQPRALAISRSSSTKAKSNDGKVLVALPASDSSSSSLFTTSLWTRHAHGSYRSYYGARRPGAVAGGGQGTPTKSDARLAVLSAEWFKDDKDYLDVGTNTGKCAWEIYQAFKPRSMVGIDIDPDLIATAQEKLAWASRRDGIPHETKVVFRCENFVGGGRDMESNNSDNKKLEEQKEKEAYDVITCLSVTKHIHLQGGDAALVACFHKIHALLRPGGHFILEPQLWRTYRKRKHVSPESLANYPTLKLRPPFKELLLEEVGFERVQDLGIPPGAPPGFQRPLFCFTKKK